MSTLAIGLLVTHGFPVPEAFFSSFESLMEHIRSGATNRALEAAGRASRVSAVKVLKATSFPIDYARNEIVREALKTDADWLLFLDMDHTFAPDTVAQLLAHDVAFVSARYHLRKPPFHACAFVKHPRLTGDHCYAPVHYGQGLIEVERGGAGCLLVRRTVLEAIRDQIGENWFRYQRGPDPPHDFSVSEDFHFWRAAREAGVTTHLDWDCESGHLQTFAITREWNEGYLDAQVRELPTLPPDRRETILTSLVVCGYPDGLTLATGDHIPPYTVTAGER